MKEIVTDGGILAEEIAKSFSKGWKTNFYKKTEELLSLAKAGQLFTESFPGGRYLYLEGENKVDLFFFLEKDAAPSPLAKWDKPLLLEQVRMAKAEAAPSEEAWEKLGFRPYLQRQRLFLSAKAAEQQERSLSFCREEQREEILKLMQECFEPYTSALPEREELAVDLREKRVLAWEEEGRLLGFLRFGREKRTAVLWQIAVRSEGRGKGIGQALVRDWLFLEKEEVSKFQLWVRQDNPAALRMYGKLGFLPDGRVAPVMIKEKGK